MRSHFASVHSSRGNLLRALVVIVLSITPLCGCSTHANRIRVARERFYAGDLAQSAETFGAQLEARKGDADIVTLDLAMVQLLDGDPRGAEEHLRVARDRLDSVAPNDPVASALSMVTDDQRRTYAGEDYEQVLIRVFLALANLMNDGQDAEAYSLQINARQQQLMQRATEQGVEGAADAYQPLAVGPYLRGVLREATLHDYDDAARSYSQVVAWQPAFHAGALDLERARNGLHSQPGHGVLYVFALVDQGPTKEEAVEVPTSAALLIADRIVSAAGEYELPPTVAPIKVPRIVIPRRQSDGAVVMVDNQPMGRTELLCDIGQLALRQQDASYPHIMARAIARRVIKKAGIYAVKDYANVNSSPWADLALTAAGVVWEATESADTRCWGVLPREIQVLRVELPAGKHQIALNSLVSGNPVPLGQPVSADIIDGRNTFVLAYFVGGQVIGHILQKTPCEGLDVRRQGNAFTRSLADSPRKSL